jgi:hypothetical protein
MLVPVVGEPPSGPPTESKILSSSIAAGVLVEAGAHVETTTLYGHLELHPAAWGDFGKTFRSESPNRLAPLDDTES